jgi:hypothetical protein
MHYPQIGTGVEGGVEWKEMERVGIAGRHKMSAKLPDVRLEVRLERFVEQLSAALDKSIPQACGSAHEVKAAYRFLG